MEVLRDCLGQMESKLLRKIKELPESVEQAYEIILRRCHQQNRQDGRRLLNIIVAAQRPLKVSEIDVALEVQPDMISRTDLDLEGSHRKQWI
ncbi:hypothetical protein N7532_006483 [Penicillium argentinense]|uniref:Uncharacterized protein n=1 Tax=Penicillium argentinense TaxID=1131581 RepID=A0A9W9KC04_9EURO|nr:uncharacterized protein N7532_006483 [Penicillium argentinense]KAJ5099482.1 hypothetical protein N7532_006483 [Penicillium argentinense]